MSKATWTVDVTHSLAEFSVKHMMFATVKGRFTQMEGSIVADPADLTTAEFTGSVDVASVTTAEPQRDAHLRSADFFDAENHPKLTFRSTRVERDGDDFKMVGDLTIRGVTKTVTWKLTFDGTGKDPWGNERIGFTAETKINRREYGLTWNAALETGGVLVGDEVKIAVHLEAIKQA
jgi:polyisoprenoid-binding protein YceI